MKILSTILIAAALACAETAQGGSVASKLTIQAVVPPTLSFRITRQPSRLQITQSDIRRGYKDVPSGTVCRITTNSMQGYVLTVSAYRLLGAGRRNAPTNVYTSVTLFADGNSYQIAPDGSVDVLLLPRGVTTETKQLNYRFYIPPSTRAGSYPWPIRLLATLM
ncbi:MAG: hypothetical protein HOO97_04260 [Sideroxydans sp.]|nr:hypothetical protein [Sideroxydans sp.]